MTVVHQPARLCELALHEDRVPRALVVIDRQAHRCGLLPVAVRTQRAYVGREPSTEGEPVCGEDDAELELEPGCEQLGEVAGLSVQPIYADRDVFCRRQLGPEHLEPAPRCARRWWLSQQQEVAPVEGRVRRSL